jgi:FMN phosphatase YigB (HAD superfamily)
MVVGMEAIRPRARLLVTDLDNTLYDWFDIWHSSFSTLLEEVARISGLPVEVLEQSARDVHQQHRTSEYSFLLNEMKCLRALHGDQDVAGIYAEAIHRFRSARKRTTHLYPTVNDTLRTVQSRGVQIVAYTDSLAFHSFQRIKALGLDGVIAAMYSPPDHEVPEGLNLSEVRTLAPSEYEFDHTVRRELPLGAAKPDPTVLKEICADFGVSPEETVYVGDSPMKDVAMAQAVGAIDVLAEYGISVNRDGYQLLRRVSHWTKADIERERQLAASQTVVPRYVLKQQFSELLDIVDFNGAPA